MAKIFKVEDARKRKLPRVSFSFAVSHSYFVEAVTWHYFKNNARFDTSLTKREANKIVKNYALWYGKSGVMGDHDTEGFWGTQGGQDRYEYTKSVVELWYKKYH